MVQAQTKYYSILENPSGHRLVLQVGRVSFTAKGKTKTLTVGFRRLVQGTVTPGQVMSGAKTARVMGYIPYISATQYTQVGYANHRILVSRGTGVISALVFSYSLVGY